MLHMVTCLVIMLSEIDALSDNIVFTHHMWVQADAPARWEHKTFLRWQCRLTHSCIPIDQSKCLQKELPELGLQNCSKKCQVQFRFYLNPGRFAPLTDIFGIILELEHIDCGLNSFSKHVGKQKQFVPFIAVRENYFDIRCLLLCTLSSIGCLSR